MSELKGDFGFIGTVLAIVLRLMDRIGDDGVWDGEECTTEDSQVVDFVCIRFEQGSFGEICRGD
jgi:hypothetical protein